jgi:hypothetical protein
VALDERERFLGAVRRSDVEPVSRQEETGEAEKTGIPPSECDAKRP